MSNRIIHFEIHAENPDRAVKFYKDVFNWEIREWTGGGLTDRYWIIMTAPDDSKEPGINGGMVMRKGPKPTEGQAVNAYVCSIVVEDIDATIIALKKAGAVEALPKFNIAGMAWQAYYKDTEGNIIGIHQPLKKM